MPTLFDPLKLGALSLPNRIIMAPLTRSRATPDGRVPTQLQLDYYVQRAGAGLIISEATSVSAMGVGYAATPGIWSDEQTAGWKKITKAVHDAGGKMVLQLWHVGRVSHPLFLNGALPEAPSSVKPKGHVSLVRPETEYVAPRSLQESEIPGIIHAFQHGAENAVKAGFDGVHIHGANGYLLDQFLQDSTNQREDEYGGVLENRARLMLEVTDACIDVWGADRVGMHLAPRMDSHDMGDSDRLGTFKYVARELGERNLGWIASREAVIGPDTKLVDSQGRPKPIANTESIGPVLKEAFGGPYIVNEGFDLASGSAALAEGSADAVAFGKLFIANSDLPRRFADGELLNAWDTATFYSGGAQGYTDYPALP
ncbi:MAG: alkene reductase [Alphaproteobacteria bacterium]|nr:alkene reductase [Alphaproteobacteria bacterium]